jgi:hypothetical protein
VGRQGRTVPGLTMGVDAEDVARHLLAQLLDITSIVRMARGRKHKGRTLAGGLASPTASATPRGEAHCPVPHPHLLAQPLKGQAQDRKEHPHLSSQYSSWRGSRSSQRGHSSTALQSHSCAHVPRGLRTSIHTKCAGCSKLGCSSG